MPRPTVTGHRLSVNKKGRKKNYFVLAGTNFVPAGCRLNVWTTNMPSRVWEADLVNGNHHSDTQLGCFCKYPQNDLTDGDKVRGYTIETIDVTVTNPDGAVSEPVSFQVLVVDDNNP